MKKTHKLINCIKYETFHLKFCICFYNQHFFLDYVLMSFFYTLHCSSNIISIIFGFSAQSPFQRFTQRPATKVHTCSMYMFRVYTNRQCSLLRKFHKKFTNERIFQFNGRILWGQPFWGKRLEKYLPVYLCIT